MKLTQVNVEKPKKIDVIKLRRFLQDQSKFIKDLLEVSQIPTHDYEEAQDDVFVGKKKRTKEEIKEAHRAKSFQDLKNRFDKVKGTTDFSVKKKLLKKSLSKRLKHKAIREERKQKKKMARIEKKKASGGEAVVKKEASAENDKAVVKPTKPVFNTQGRIVFSKFDFSESGVTETKKKGEKNPKKILENLEKQKEQVKSLKEAGETEKAITLQEKITWKNALAKAEGQKIKDDPILLKKSVKKMEQRKNKSAKKWEQRLEGVAKSKEDRQKKRSSNIQKRNQDKKKKVMQKAAKRGRLIQS